MSPHVDILERPDRLAGWLLGSVAMHVAIASALIWYAFIGPGKTFKIGSPNPGGRPKTAHISQALRLHWPLAKRTSSVRFPAPWRVGEKKHLNRV